VNRLNKLNELRAVSSVVRQLLETVPETRSDDCLLYALVCNNINPETSGKSFSEVMVNRVLYSIPAPETVRRARQKIQENTPYLKGSGRCQEARKELEEDFRQFARCE
jgi:hypothetical protein